MEVLLLDVREPNEWKEDGIVEGAKCIHFADLPDKMASLPKDRPIAVTCSVGNRTSIAISILEKAGFKNVSNVLGRHDCLDKSWLSDKKIVFRLSNRNKRAICRQALLFRNALISSSSMQRVPALIFMNWNCQFL